MTDTKNATHEQLVERAVELIRLSMQFNELTDEQIRQNAEIAGDTILRAFIEHEES